MSQRVSMRFQADPLDHAQVDFNDRGPQFNPTTVGLIVNESFSGSGLIVRCDRMLEKEQVIRVQVGQVGPLPARIVWLKELEPKLFKLGIEYLD